MPSGSTWTISSPDRRQLGGPQHALLCVKQAKSYLDDMFSRCPTWDDCLREFAQSNLEDWFCEGGDKDFGAPQSYAKNVKNGPSEYVIRRFLGGAFAKGHGVRDALAILNRLGKKKPASPRRRSTRAGTIGTDRAGYLRAGYVGRVDRAT